MSLVRLMVRHWRVTGPAAAATLLLVVAALVLSSPTYAASASVALFSPPDAPEAEDASSADPAAGENPFTRYGDLSVVADIVARRMDSDAERAALKAEGVSGYEVVANRLQRGPLVEVTGTGPNPAAAINSAEVVVAEFETVLTEMQESEGADPDYFITSGPIEPPETAVAQVGSTLRTAIAALAVGGLGTLGLAVVAESFTRRREAARSATDVAGSTPLVAADRAPESGDDYPERSSGRGRSAPKASGPADDHPQRSSGRGRSAAKASGPADDHPQRSSGRGRSAAKASGPADDLPKRSSGRGRSAAPTSGDPEAGARADAPNGSRRRAPRIASVPDPDRREATQNEWNRWLPSAGTFAPDNGHEKPTSDRST
jgi:hypothetical protein